MNNLVESIRDMSNRIKNKENLETIIFTERLKELGFSDFTITEDNSYYLLGLQIIAKWNTNVYHFKAGTPEFEDTLYEGLQLHLEKITNNNESLNVQKSFKLSSTNFNNNILFYQDDFENLKAVVSQAGNQRLEFFFSKVKNDLSLIGNVVEESKVHEERVLHFNDNQVIVEVFLNNSLKIKIPSLFFTISLFPSEESVIEKWLFIFDLIKKNIDGEIKVYNYNLVEVIENILNSSFASNFRNFEFLSNSILSDLPLTSYPIQFIIDSQEYKEVKFTITFNSLNDSVQVQADYFSHTFKENLQSYHFDYLENLLKTIHSI